MIRKFLFDNKYLLLTISTIFIFIIFKIPYLKLPFYSDESWVYGPAVRIMAKNGISLMPGSLPVNYLRGHPLFFFASNALWIRIFGDSLISIHLFNLLISCILIFITYLFGKKYFNDFIGFSSSFILCLQPIFLAQSTMVLPEVMLTLFCVLALYFYFQHKLIWYSIFACLATLTKETGVVVILVCCIIFLINNWRRTESRPKSFFVGITYTLLPILPFVLFIVLQRIVNGWYLFPEHLGYISFNINTFWKKFVESCLSYLTLYQGRNFLTFSMIIMLIYISFRKNKIEAWNIALYLFIFVFIFVLVSSFNFFTNRYILVAIPIFILLSMGIIFQIIKNTYFRAAYLLIFTLCQIQYINNKSTTDHYLGFIDAVRTNQDMVKYCLENDLRDKRIGTYFFTQVILTNKYSGYVNSDEVFTAIEGENENSDFFIIANYDSNDLLMSYRTRKDLTIIKRFERGQAWIELYKRNI